MKTLSLNKHAETKTLKGFSTYPLIELNNRWYYMDETSNYSEVSYDSEIEAAIALGKYIAFIEKKWRK